MPAPRRWKAPLAARRSISLRLEESDEVRKNGEGRIQHENHLGQALRRTLSELFLLVVDAIR
jgi:hypothetical protein